MLKKLIALAFSAAVVTAVTAAACFAADSAAYQIDVTYGVTNNSGADIDDLQMSLSVADCADDSAYQPDTKLSRNFTDAVLSTESGREVYSFALEKGESKSVSFTWTFSGGEFDQHPARTETYEKALAAYMWVVENISYGEEQDFALPKTANCQTFAEAFWDLLAEENIKCRRVYGYTVRLVDDETGELTYGKDDISEKNMHMWCEFYDPDSGEWIFADPTFDDENTEFRFFGKCPADFPHLAMYYGGVPSRYVSWEYRDSVKITQTVVLRRAEYTDKDAETENLLERLRREENETVTLASYAESKGLTLTIGRNATCFSIDDGKNLNIPPDYMLFVDEFGDLCVTGDGRNIRLQFAPGGAFRLFA
jgi:hypothetical protein